MNDWVKDDSGLSIKDICRKQPYKMEPHQFATVKKIPWLRCKSCGLLTLRNKFTQWCVKMGCNASDHPSYESHRRDGQ